MLLGSLQALETATALLSGQLRRVRMTPLEGAVYANALVRAKPARGLEARVDTLIQEIRNARQAIEAG